MEYRQLGRSGLRVSALGLGTMTFGGRGNFAAVGSTDASGASRQIDMCLERGINLIDTANVYSRGLSEEILSERQLAPGTRSAGEDVEEGGIGVEDGGSHGCAYPELERGPTAHGPRARILTDQKKSLLSYLCRSVPLVRVA